MKEAGRTKGPDNKASKQKERKKIKKKGEQRKIMHTDNYQEGHF